VTCQSALSCRNTVFTVDREYFAPTGGINPRALTPSPTARKAWIDFYNWREVNLAGKFAPIVSLENKLAEHAARLAAVLTMTAHVDTGSIEALGGRISPTSTSFGTRGPQVQILLLRPTKSGTSDRPQQPPARTRTEMRNETRDFPSAAILSRRPRPHDRPWLRKKSVRWSGHQRTSVESAREG
jgi:hypothetical protein